ncbi:MAG TPA: transposase [Rhodothermales bacterium]|nr:transposase [Rhodothermales bacterium]
MQNLLQSDDRLQQLLEAMPGQLLQAEMTEHLQAEPQERTDTPTAMAATGAGAPRA